MKHEIEDRDEKVDNERNERHKERKQNLQKVCDRIHKDLLANARVARHYDLGVAT